MRKLRFIAPACLLLAACVSSGPESQLGKQDKGPRRIEMSRTSDCVFQRNIDDFEAIDDNYVVLYSMGRRKAYLAHVTTIPLLIIDDLAMRKLPQTAAEDLLEIIMRRYERASTLLTSNRPVEDWGKLLGDTAAVAAFLDRLLHHAHVLTCGPRSWRTRLQGERSDA